MRHNPTQPRATGSGGSRARAQVANEIITIEKIERETDKALLIACEAANGAGRFGRKVWFPKSQVSVQGNELICPAWLAKAKLADLFGEHAGRTSWFN